jgi:hypothetical protein
MTYGEVSAILDGKMEEVKEAWYLNSRIYHLLSVVHSKKGRAPKFTDVYPFNESGDKPKSKPVTVEQQREMESYWEKLTEKHPIKDVG